MTTQKLLTLPYHDTAARVTLLPGQEHAEYVGPVFRQEFRCGCVSRPQFWCLYQNTPRPVERAGKTPGGLSLYREQERAEPFEML